MTMETNILTILVFQLCVGSAISSEFAGKEQNKINRADSILDTQIPAGNSSAKKELDTVLDVTKESNISEPLESKPSTSYKPELTARATKDKSTESEDSALNTPGSKVSIDKQENETDPLQTNTYSEHGIITNILFMFLGAIISLYGTIVFDRFKRFSEILRCIGEARQLYEGYPTSLTKSELLRAGERATNYWRLLESKQWVLNADQHYQAAAKLDQFKNFIYRSIACIGNMQKNKTKGLPLDEYLSEFGIEYGRITRENFIQFEKNLEPSFWALLQPFPHPVLPKKATTVLIDYFDRLL